MATPYAFAEMEREKAKKKKEISELNNCRLRHIAYGFLGCRNCPMSCCVKENNLNILANMEEHIPMEEHPCVRI